MTARPSARGDRSTPLLRAKVREVFRHLPQALVGDVEAIHQMRVAGRRLRTALLHLSRKPDGRRVRRALLLVRDLTRTAGASRDFDVTLEVVESDLRPRQRSPEQALLLRRLRQSRSRSRAHMVDALLDLEIARLRRNLRGILKRGGERSLAVLVRLRESQAQEARTILATFAELGTRFEAEALHRLRISARRLRYAIELEGEVTRRESPATEILRGLQDELGRIRDLYLVSAWFEAQATRSIGQRQGDVANEARLQAARFLEKSTAEHVTLLAHDPVARINEVMKSSGQRNPAA
jgi:CHAD domain-containing protein